MHESVMAFLKRTLTEELVKGSYILEVGSLNVNGTPRTIVEAMEPASYVGIDIRGGDDVDIITDICETHKYLAVQDIIISTQMLEHAEDWRCAIYSMKRLLRPGGLILITASSPGYPFHEHPSDYWRFTKEDMRLIFADFTIRALEDDPETQGVFLFAENTPHYVHLEEIEVAAVKHDS